MSVWVSLFADFATVRLLLQGSLVRSCMLCRGEAVLVLCSSRERGEPSQAIMSVHSSSASEAATRSSCTAGAPSLASAAPTEPCSSELSASCLLATCSSGSPHSSLSRFISCVRARALPSKSLTSLPSWSTASLNAASIVMIAAFAAPTSVEEAPRLGSSLDKNVRREWRERLVREMWVERGRSVSSIVLSGLSGSFPWQCKACVVLNRVLNETSHPGEPTDTTLETSTSNHNSRGTLIKLPQVCNLTFTSPRGTHALIIVTSDSPPFQRLSETPSRKPSTFTNHQRRSMRRRVHAKPSVSSTYARQYTVDLYSCAACCGFCWAYDAPACIPCLARSGLLAAAFMPADTALRASCGLFCINAAALPSAVP